MNMQLCHTLACLGREKRPLLLAAGFFDGVHRGHQAVVKEVMRAAKRRGALAWIMTFDIHPLKLLKPEAAPPLLTATAHKIRLLEALGVDGCLVLPFTRVFAVMEPEEFVLQLTRSAPNLRGIVVGSNWTFGKNGCGTPDLLAKFGRRYGFEVRVVRQVRWRGGVVSSTRIRKALFAGKLADADAMLGRVFSVVGTVVTGRGFGRRLGLPTANISPHNEVLPASGVYAVRVALDGKIHNGAANIGFRPTIEENRPSGRLLEVHVFDLEANLYHREMEVFFMERIRPERRFATVQALKLRIMKDIKLAKKILFHRK